jgi:hypothetical protein
MFSGSPRQLALGDNIADVEKRLKEVPGCFLSFRIFPHSSLLMIRNLISDNEIVGR